MKSFTLFYYFFLGDELFFFLWKVIPSTCGFATYYIWLLKSNGKCSLCFEM